MLCPLRIVRLIPIHACLPVCLYVCMYAHACQAGQDPSHYHPLSLGTGAPARAVHIIRLDRPDMPCPVLPPIVLLILETKKEKESSLPRVSAGPDRRHQHRQSIRKKQ